MGELERTSFRCCDNGEGPSIGGLDRGLGEGGGLAGELGEAGA